jgi:hypothetical protein
MFGGGCWWVIEGIWNCLVLVGWGGSFGGQVLLVKVSEGGIEIDGCGRTQSKGKEVGQSPRCPVHHMELAGLENDVPIRDVAAIGFADRVAIC